MPKNKQSTDDSLPTEADFDPVGCDLDAQSAWQHFGGLTLEAAKVRFRENPMYYQEDFMFMGGKAFAYYFPVIEEFLLGAPDVEDDEDHESWILAHCIKAQFDWNTAEHVRHLTTRIVELANFVRNNIRRFGVDDNERQRVAEAWTELVAHVQPHLTDAS